MGSGGHPSRSGELLLGVYWNGANNNDNAPMAKRSAAVVAHESTGRTKLRANARRSLRRPRISGHARYIRIHPSKERALGPHLSDYWDPNSCGAGIIAAQITQRDSVALSAGSTINGIPSHYGVDVCDCPAIAAFPLPTAMRAYGYVLEARARFDRVWIAGG